MRKYRLGFDCDGVVYDFVDSIRTHIHNTTGRPLEELPAANTWNFFSDQWGYTLEEYKQHMLDGIHAGLIFAKGEPEPGSVEVLNRLHQDHEIIFITSRSGFGTAANICKDATIKWLVEHQFPFDGLILSDDKTNRGVDMLLDDAPYQIDRGLQAGERVVIFDRPWNVDVTGAPRVKTWYEFEDLIKGGFLDDKHSNHFARTSS